MASADTQVAIVGAGPYGLAAALHLRRAGVDTRVFGEPMSFWHGMPKGMLLRSNWGATNIAELKGPLSLVSFQAETGAQFGQPVPLERFVEYGEWFQQKAVPDLDLRRVTRVEKNGSRFTLTLAGGERLESERVVVACGIAPFAWRPPEFARLPPALASHTGDHSDLGRFAGQSVAVVGGGQSARESAALMAQAGARVEVFIRGKAIVWLRGQSVKKRIGWLGPIVYAPTDVGPLWYSRLVAVPGMFTKLPHQAQDRIARRSIRPAGSHWLKERLVDVPLNVDRTIVSATPSDGRLMLSLSDGSERTVDHLILGTGYRVDVARYGFLAPEVLDSVRRVGGYPILAGGLESSLSGLHFLGAPAAWSVGPIMRFVSGSWYAGRTLKGHIVRERARADRQVRQLRWAGEPWSAS